MEAILVNVSEKSPNQIDRTSIKGRILFIMKNMYVWRSFPLRVFNSERKCGN